MDSDKTDWMDDEDNTDREYEASRVARHQAQRWDTTTLQEDFEVIGFLAPYVVVKRRSDGVRGTLEFTHMPRVYFNWQEGTI